MDTLPSEVLHIILRNLGGIDFVKFKTITKWAYIIASDFEGHEKPTVWQKFVIKDFLCPCIESLAPWIYTCDVNDLVLWKELYIKLYTSCLLTRVGREVAIVKKEVFKEGGIKLVTDVKFIYDYLFLISTPKLINLVGLADKMRLKAHYRKTEVVAQISQEDDIVLSPVTLVQENSDNFAVKLHSIASDSSKEVRTDYDVHVEVCLPPNDFAQGACMSIWTNTCIVYQQQFAFDENEFNIYNYNEVKISLNRIVSLKSPVNDVVCLTYNQERVVLITSDEKICLFPNSSSKSVPVFTFSLSQAAFKVKMLDDFIVCLFADGSLKTCQVVTERETCRLSLSEWVDLDLDEHEATNCQPVVLRVADFVLQGHLFAFAEFHGVVFVSYMDTLTHHSIWRNLKLLHEVPIYPGGFISRMSVDQENGVKFALLERWFNGTMWISTVHVFELG